MNARGEGRLLSLDAYRGFVMLAMASAGLGLAKVAANLDDKAIRTRVDPSWWGTLIERLATQVEHVEWVGCSFWDLIQPSFIFIVGVAMPFSLAARRAKGDSFGLVFRHTLVRSVVLIALGVFLASNGSKHTNWTFTNVLAQIGLGCPFVFLLVGRSFRTQLVVAVVVLVGYWALFATWPLPGPDTDLSTASVDPKRTQLLGFAAHWGKNVNVASDFDRWFLNLFPRPDGKPFVVNEGGYATLNFVPSAMTMLFGVMAGQWLRSDQPRGRQVLGLVVAGLVVFALGTVLDVRGICPAVKRIWTPSWTLYSAGWTCWLLALFVEVIEVRGWRRWAFPLVVVGTNSIVMYLMAQLLKPWVKATLQRHLGTFLWWLNDRFQLNVPDEPFVGDWGPLIEASAVLFVFWLVCWSLHRRRIFIKV